MTATSSCGICSGPLRFLYPGEAPAGGSDAFAPSCHAVSGHGDLYACERCGTVQQRAHAYRSLWPLSAWHLGAKASEPPAGASKG